jgi:hypothetical protein
VQATQPTRTCCVVLEQHTQTMYGARTLRTLDLRKTHP